MIWFDLFVVAVGSLYILVAVYEWTWIRKLEPTWPLRQVGWRTARKIYLLVGIGGLVFAIADICGILLSSNSPLLFIISFTVSYFFADALFKYRNNQSIMDLFRNSQE